MDLPWFGGLSRRFGSRSMQRDGCSKPALKTVVQVQVQGKGRKEGVQAEEVRRAQVKNRKGHRRANGTAGLVVWSSYYKYQCRPWEQGGGLREW